MIENYRNEFPQILKKARKEAGMTHEVLCEKMGINYPCSVHWESGRNFPRVGTLIKLARLFGMTVDQLLGMEGKYES